MNELCGKITGWIKKIPAGFWLTGIVLLGLVIHIVSFVMTPVPSRDSIYYLQILEVWQETGAFSDVLDSYRNFWIPPFPLYLMLLLTKLGFSALHAGVYLNIFFATMMPLIVYGIAYECFQRKDIALVSAFLLIFNPSVNDLSIEVQRDMGYLFFSGCVILLGCAAIRRKKMICWCGAGSMSGCSLLFRFETVEFFPILAFVWFYLIFRRDLEWKHCLLSIFAFGVSCILTLFVLSAIMGTNDFLWQNYGTYFMGKKNRLELNMDEDTGRDGK